jgi:hypothetical protein
MPEPAGPAEPVTSRPRPKPSGRPAPEPVRVRAAEKQEPVRAATSENADAIADAAPASAPPAPTRATDSIESVDSIGSAQPPGSVPLQRPSARAAAAELVPGAEPRGDKARTDAAPAGHTPVPDRPRQDTDKPAVPSPVDTAKPVAPPRGEPVPASDGSGRPAPGTGPVEGEPAAELLLASEKSKLSSSQEPVLVIDGRPRYHLDGCPQLASMPDGTITTELPVSEAAEAGFTPCTRCAAATRILVALRR